MHSTPKRKARSKASPGARPVALLVTENAPRQTEASSRAAEVARQEESDRRAKSAISAFERMGNAFYKDPDDDISSPSTSSPNRRSTSDASLDLDHSDSQQAMPLARNDPVRPSKADPGPLDAVINRQKRVSLILADCKTADLFQALVGDSPRMSVKKLDALPGQSLIIYAENSGDFAEISSIVDVSIRSSIRRLTLSPDSNGMTEALVHKNLTRRAGRQAIRVTFNGRMVEGISLNSALAVVALACVTGAFAAWLSLAFDVNNLVIDTGLYALRVIFIVKRVSVLVIRLTCLLVQTVLDFIVRHLSALRDQSARVAAGN